MKKCPSCNELKEPTEFYHNKGRNDNKSVYCKICFNSKRGREKKTTSGTQHIIDEFIKQFRSRLKQTTEDPKTCFAEVSKSYPLPEDIAYIVYLRCVL